MGDDILLQLGIQIGMIIFAAGLVKPTIDQARGALLLSTGQCVALNYVLSFALQSVLVMATMGTAALPIVVARAVVSGWLTATYSGMITDVHNAAKRKVNEAKDEPIVEEEPPPTL